MKIKNEYVKIKQGKNEVELHNLILDKYLSLFASSVLETKYKGLDSCLINCTIQEEITPSMDAMHWDFYLNEQNLYNNSDYKGASKIITKYLYEPNFKEQIQSFIGQKILSIGFAQMVEEPTLPDGSDATFELYAILDVSNYNLYVQDMQEFVVERVDTVTTDMVFSSDTEKFPIHLSPRGNSYFDQQEETGTREVGILNAIGKGYNSMFPTALMPKSNFNITRNENEIDITGLSIQENTGEELYPSNELYPKKKWSEEIQKSEKGSEVIIEGNNKEAFVDIKGKSEQATRSGKNLCKMTGSAVTGISFVDSEINITGTFNENTWQPFDAISLQAGTYTFSFSCDFSNGTYFTFNSQQVPANLKKLTISINQATNIRFGLVLFAGTYNNNTIKVQIEQGSTATSYEPYGASPSPDYPSEIHSVADDVNLWQLSSSYTTSTGSEYAIRDTSINKIPAGTYVLSLKKSVNVNMFFNFKDSLNQEYTVFLDGVEKETINFTTDIVKVAIYIYGNQACTISNIKLQKGTTATPYSPYNQGTVTIKQRGKNYFNANANTKPTIQVSNNGATIKLNTSSLGGGAVNGEKLSVLAPDLVVGETYKLSLISSKSNLQYIYVGSLWISGTNKTITQKMLDSTTVFYSTSSEEVTITDMQIVKENEDITNYETYQTPHDYIIQTEPLRSLPNGVKDTIEEDGIHRRVGRRLLQASDIYDIVTTGTIPYVRIAKSSVSGIGMTTEFAKNNTARMKSYKITGNVNYSNTNNGEFNTYYDRYYLAIFDNRFTDLATAKQLLEGEKIIYELATEVIEPLTEEQMEVLGSIQTFEGYNNFTTTDDLQPVIQVTEYENCVYPQKAQMNWIFYQYGIYKFIDTVTGYEYTGRLYREAKNTNKSGNLSLKIKYERGE